MLDFGEPAAHGRHGRFGTPVLVFSGGEPLMRPDIFELMSEARKRGLPYARHHGTLLDETMSDRLPAAAPIG